MQTFKTEKCLLHDLSFAPDGRKLLVGCYRRVLLDTLGTKPPVELEPIGGEFTAYAELALGGTALIYIDIDDGSVRVWDLASRQLSAWAGAGQGAHDLVVSPDGATVYIAYDIEKEFESLTEIRAFEIATGKQKVKFPTRDDHFGWLTMSADGRRLAGRGSYSVGVWDVTAPKKPGSFEEIKAGKLGNHIGGIALSADGTRLAIITNRGLALWDIASGATASEVFRSGKHKRRVTSVACHPSKPLIATGDNAGQIFLWDHEGNVLTRYDWGLGEVYALCFAPDGLRCAATDDMGTVVIWDIDP